MRLLQSILRFFFSLLYHQFAWSYDLVSTTVSLGHWQEWVRASLPYLHGRTLEIGYGPGHLQAYLHENSHVAFGLDESRQMARQAGRLLMKKGSPVRLTRGDARHLPFTAAAFGSVVATFPSEYIFDPKTLREIQRVLAPAGTLVILPMAWITGGKPLERLAAWLFRLTGEAPGQPRPITAEVREQFQRAGLWVRSEMVKLKSSQVLVIIATNVPSV